MIEKDGIKGASDGDELQFPLGVLPERGEQALKGIREYPL
jgi:hypothetical protein